MSDKTETVKALSDDDSPLAEAERELVASLQPGQAELIAQWMRLYGYAWQAQRPTSGRAVSQCFDYSAERLRILDKDKFENQLPLQG